MSRQYHLSSDMHLTSAEIGFFNARIQSLVPVERVFFALLLETGPRVSELLNVTRQDIDIETKSILYRGLKGSRDRALPIRQDLFNDLLDVLNGSQSDEVFTFTVRHAQRRFHSVMSPTGLGLFKKSLHCLRHTFAVELYRRTRDIKLVQAALGHSNIRNTMIYTEIDMSQDLLTRVLPKAL